MKRKAGRIKEVGTGKKYRPRTGRVRLFRERVIGARASKTDISYVGKYATESEYGWVM